MRKRWFALLSVVTLILISLVAFFIAAQFKESKYKPRFRLTEKGEPVTGYRRRSIMEMKGNIISSIAKNSKKNLKGPIPESIEFDISSTQDRGSSSLVKVFENAYVDIPGYKGYTHVLKVKLPVDKFLDKEVEQHGLPTGVSLEAVLTYLKSDSEGETPLVVCPVGSIDDKTFSCYLKDSENSWFLDDGINSLDPMDDAFGFKAAQHINNHYKFGAASIPEPQEEPSSQEPETYNRFELDISLKEGFENHFFSVSQVDRVKVKGFTGYAYRFNEKSEITKFTYSDVEQNGLPVNVPFEALLTFYQQGKLNGYPIAVCGVKSKNSKSFECYLMTTQNSWVFNSEISQLKAYDLKFGEKASQIINQHYSFSDSESSASESSETESSSAHSESEHEQIPEPSVQQDDESSSKSETPYTSDSEQSESESDTQSETGSETPTQEEPENQEEQSSISVIDIGKRESDEGESPEVQEFEDLNIPHYRAFGQLLPNKMTVEKFVSRGVDQSGLPTNQSFEAVVSFFHDEYEDPLVVCPVMSMDDMKFDCYLKDANSVWSKNSEMSNLDFTSDDFGPTAAELVNKHYGIQSSTTDDSSSNKDDSETDSTSASDSEYDINNDADADYEDQEQSSISVIDIGKRESDEGESPEVQEFEDLNIPHYRAFGQLLPNKMTVEKFVSRGVDQSGLPTNQSFEAVVSFFHDEYEDPLVVCPVMSMDDMKFDCYLKDANSVWSKNSEMSNLDFTSDDFGPTAAELVNKHYGIKDSSEN